MFNFLSLPGEIRNEIYDHAAFPHHDAVAVHHCTTPRDVVATVLKSPIFRLSSQIRTEALVRLFRTKDFDFSDYASALNFLTWAGPYGETLITRVTFLGLKPETKVDDAVVKKLAERLGKMEALKTVTIRKAVGPVPGALYDCNLVRMDWIWKKADEKGFKIKVRKVGE